MSCRKNDIVTFERAGRTCTARVYNAVGRIVFVWISNEVMLYRETEVRKLRFFEVVRLWMAGVLPPRI